MASTSNYVQGIDKELFYNIELELGEITDFKLDINEKSVEIKYKSNGIEKSIYSNDVSMKMFIQSFLYCAKIFTNV